MFMHGWLQPSSAIFVHSQTSMPPLPDPMPPTIMNACSERAMGGDKPRNAAAAYVQDVRAARSVYFCRMPIK